jgi:hypothetical protein
MTNLSRAAQVEKILRMAWSCLPFMELALVAILVDVTGVHALCKFYYLKFKTSDFLGDVFKFPRALALIESESR